MIYHQDLTTLPFDWKRSGQGNAWGSKTIARWAVRVSFLSWSYNIEELFLGNLHNKNNANELAKTQYNAFGRYFIKTRAYSR